MSLMTTSGVANNFYSLKRILAKWHILNLFLVKKTMSIAPKHFS